MSDTKYLISEAAKLAEVESHVLRYWEEELKLPIGRNEMGHRYYTRWDIQVFLSIKELKKKGHSLKEIKEMVPLLYKNAPKETPKLPDKQPAVTHASKRKAKRSKSRGPAPKQKQEGDKPVLALETDKKEKAEAVPKTTSNPVPKTEKKEIPENFYKILEKLVTTRLKENHPEEARYKELDKTIRTHQESRRLIAATIQQTKKEKKRRFAKKR